MIARVRRVMQFSAQERMVLRAALLRLWGARVGLWLFPFAKVYGWFLRRAVPRRYSTPYDVAMIIRNVQRASRLVPRATCLVRALVTYQLLRQSGHEAMLRIGVTRADDTFGAHAWVESNGSIIIGAYQGEYAVLPLQEIAIS